MRALLLLLLLSACAVQRPPSVFCPAFAAPFGQAPMDTMTASLQTATAVRRGPLQLLSLSAGGQWGAYGAGFLAGWSGNPTEPRPDFDLVTGVSAGAILSLPAFAGPEFDDRLDLFRGIGEADVSRRRSIFSLLSAPSAADVSPLEEALRHRLDDDLIRQVAERHRQGARLFVAAVNLDSTDLEVFDLGAAASDRGLTLDERRDCLLEAVLASAAIPGLLPPRHINDALYVDGGTREQIFLRALDEALDGGGRPDVTASLIINGDLNLSLGPATDTLPGYLTRSITIIADEVLRDSIAETVAFAEATPGWTVRGIVPRVDPGACGFDEPPVATFDACFTEKLFDTGRAVGAGRIPWQSGGALRDAAYAR